jgi:hypothetical protein
MALLSYLYGITSERRLVQEISLNLAYLWFIGYDIDEPVPDHSVLSKARRRFGPTTYLGFFTEIVRQCERAGLIRGNKLYVDSTLVQADADSDSVGSRALIAQLPDIGTHVRKLWEDNPDSSLDEDEARSPDPTADAKRDDPEASAQTRSEAAASTDRETSPLSLEVVGPTVDTTTQDQGEQTASPSLHLAGPTDPPNKVIGLLNERQVSRVDPEAELVRRARVLAGLYYKVHAGVDAGRARIITAVEVTGGGIADEYLLERIIREHEGNVRRRLNEVVADTKYGTIENYERLEQLGIRASIPMRDNSAENRAMPPKLFRYDASSDSFICPAGQRMKRNGVTTKTAAHPLIVYRARPRHCASCERKEACCGEAKARSVSRAVDKGVRQRAASYLATNQARQSIRHRKAWVETIFGDGKERRGLRRADCRGLDWMRVQAYMTAIAQDVRQLAMRKRNRPGNGVVALEKGRPLAPASLIAFVQFAVVTKNHNFELKLFLN